MSTFGRAFRVTTFGESHCRGVGCVVDGCPPRLALTEDDIQPQLTRRRPGQSRLTTPRDEKDRVSILSGTERGVTLGTPIGLFVANQNVRPGDYKEMSLVPRPGHADYTYQIKYGVRASSGGGRSSARETIGRVAAGAIAEKWLREAYGVRIVAWVSSCGTERIAPEGNFHPSGRPWTREEVDRFGTLRVLRNPASWRVVAEAEVAEPTERAAQQRVQDEADEQRFVIATAEGENTSPSYCDWEGHAYNRRGERIQISPEELSKWLTDEVIPVRCPHPASACRMATLIRTVRSEKDSTGGTVQCVCSGVPPGLGEPCFDKLEAKLAHAMLSLPATKGFEIGSGFEGTVLRGSQHNDPFSAHPSGSPGLLQAKTNNAGGTLGGITSGSDLTFRVAVKPVSTIGRPQATATFKGEDTTLEARGRHDPCVLPRTPPLVEAMAALVLADAALLQRTRIDHTNTTIPSKEIVGVVSLPPETKDALPSGSPAMKRARTGNDGAPPDAFASTLLQ